MSMFRNFNETFGFKPTRRGYFALGDPCMGRDPKEVAIVDSVLGFRAESLRVAFESETRVKKNAPCINPWGSYFDMINIRNHKIEVRRAENNVRRAKKYFWQAYGLAKNKGFPIRGSFKAYLNPPKVS